MDATPNPPSPRSWLRPWTLLRRAPRPAERSDTDFAERSALLDEEPPRRLPPLARFTLGLCVALVLAGCGFEAYRRLTGHGSKIVAAERIPVRIVLKNTPSWLHTDLLALIRKETEDFAQRDWPTMHRFENPLDQDVLREIAERYTSRDIDGVDRQTVGNNAWIKRITAVKRTIEPDRKTQWIEIHAEYRRPAAVFAVPVDAQGHRVRELAQIRDPRRVPAMRYYLVDADLTRLPGEYPTNVFANSGLLTLYGIDEDVPRPGCAYSVPEATAGLQLARTLAAEKFAPQVAMVNLWNFRGRGAEIKVLDKTDPHITLLTPYGTEVRWGRAIGEEGLYELKARGKLMALSQVFSRFSRIDANRDWVDVRFEQVKVPATVPTTRTASDAGGSGPLHG